MVICICINTALMFTTFQIVLVISLCCIFRCRIPRTKTEIEANSRRKSLLKNFNAKLGQLKAAELDDMNYRNGEYFFYKIFHISWFALNLYNHHIIYIYEILYHGYSIFFNKVVNIFWHNKPFVLLLNNFFVCEMQHLLSLLFLSRW